jgi:Acetyltransferase (GNAT) domain
MQRKAICTLTPRRHMLRGGDQASRDNLGSRLSHVPVALPFAPAVDFAWRMARAHWGRGYAEEAARTAIQDGFVRLGLAVIVALYGAGEPPVVAIDGAARHDSRSGGRFRPPAVCRRPSALPARALST